MVDTGQLPSCTYQAVLHLLQARVAFILKYLSDIERNYEIYDKRNKIGKVK